MAIRGRVVDARTGAPVGRALVRIPGLDLSRVSGDDGVFDLEAVPLGTYEMRVTRFGYETARGDFAIRRPGEFTLRLVPLATLESTGPGRVLGRVVDEDTGAPLEAAGVTLVGTGETRTTDAAGRFGFLDVAPGPRVVRVEHLGYGTREDSLVVPAARTLDVEIRVPVDPVVLGGLTVTVEARSRRLEAEGFYRRMEAGPGRRWTREEIAERAPYYLTDLLGTTPGLTVDRTNAPVPVVLSRRGATLGSGRGCRLPVYLDGIRVSGFDLDSLDPSSVEAVEVYHGAAETPVEYSMGCGVILVWLRY